MSRYAGWENFKPGSVKPPRQKFNNVPTVTDGVRFDSKREADRYVELKFQQSIGAITDLELQPKFPLHVTTPAGIKVEIGTFRADFKYVANGQTVYEDAKGGKATATEAYKLRKRIVEAEYNIVIVEV